MPTNHSILEKLTDEQVAAMAVYRDRWIEKGTSTEQSNEEDFRACFEAVKSLCLEGDESLDRYVVCDSPSHMIKMGVDKQNMMSESSYGQWEASWLSYYTFFRDECGIEIEEKINHFLLLAEHTCWVYIQEDTKTVYFSRKPIEVNMRNGLLHNENGPSILFADGFSIWSIEGHPVTEQIVMKPETLTIKQIHSESNADIQSIMVNRFGWARYVEETGCKLLDSRHNDIENTVEALYDTKTFGLRLFCTCPTGRVFVKGVNKEEVTSNTCEAAQNWLSGYNLNARKKFRTIGRT